MKTPDISEDVRSRLALALDVDDLVEAGRLGRRMSPWFSVAKVGLELFSAAGPEAVGAFVDQGYEVFLDLKLHDIPTTVGKAARVLGSLGVSYVTVHASGGVDMLSAAVHGLNEGAAAAGLPAPMVLGVTVLTSEPDAPRALLEQRLTSAVEADCGGVICAADDLVEVTRVAPELLTETSLLPTESPALGFATKGTACLLGDKRTSLRKREPARGRLSRPRLAWSPQASERFALLP